MKYASSDQAVDMIRIVGPASLLQYNKYNIKSALRLLPVHPTDFDLWGFTFKCAYYFDKALPTGRSVSCATFEKFSTFLQWCVAFRASSNHITCYLDNFLVAGKAATGHCTVLLQHFTKVMQELRVPFGTREDRRPSNYSTLPYLGIELDMVAAV